MMQVWIWAMGKKNIGWIPEIFMRQDLIAMEGEAEREIKNDLQASLKGKEKTGSEGERHKSERDLLKKEWNLLSPPQNNFFFA